MRPARYAAVRRAHKAHPLGWPSVGRLQHAETTRVTFSRGAPRAHLGRRGGESNPGAGPRSDGARVVMMIMMMVTWPHLNPIFPYFFIGFLTIIYKEPYKKQGFLIQFAKWDRFPTSTQMFSKNLFGHFRLSFVIIYFF